MKRFSFSFLSIFLALLFVSEALATEWNVSLWGKRRAFTEHVEKLAELVEKKTNGEFKLNLSYGGLSKNRENLDGISIGAFEMAQICAGYHRDKNPTLTGLELPFLGVSSLEQERDLSMMLYSHPEVVKDLSRWNAYLLMPSPMPQYNLVGVGKAPSSLKDFDGLTVRLTGGMGEAMKMIGAVPTSVTATEVRQALDSGAVKAVGFAPHAHMAFATIEKGEWWTTNLNPGTVNCPVVINKDALDSLSVSEREALLGSVDEALDHYITFYKQNTMKRWGPELDKRGIKRITFTAQEIESFRDATANPIAEKWVRDNSARGIAAQELYDLVRLEISRSL